jgi:hypothetical protein
MPQLGNGTGLPQETRTLSCVGEGRGRKSLQRNQTSKLRIANQPDDAHATASQLPLNFEATQHDLLDRVSDGNEPHTFCVVSQQLFDLGLERRVFLLDGGKE